MKHRTRWDLPKGHLDPGETKKQAAMRELSEETGLQSSDVWMDPHFVFEHRYWVTYQRDGGKKRFKELTIYLGLLVQDKPILVTEHESYEWHTWTPPHQIQIETIDPLLAQVGQYFETQPNWPG